MNIVEALHLRAGDGDSLALRFLTTGEVNGPIEEWTFAELHARALRVAARLTDHNLGGRPALLAFSPGLDFVAAFIGCLYAKVPAVPVYPPNPGDLVRAGQRIAAVAEDSGARHVLTIEPVRRMAASLGARLQSLVGLEWLATDTFPRECAEGWRPLAINDRDIAFLQYTSGSTGRPKGVVVRHSELWFNLVACKTSLGYRRHIMTWLPPYHDMGLIGTLLSPLGQGVSVTLMAPHDFLKKPTRWMRAVAHFDADMTVGPNFAYHLAAKKTRPADLAGLDLSRLDVAVVGAEPVRASMVRDFLDTFGPVGLRPCALFPSYGMAEATLLISTKEQPAAPTVVGFDRRALERGQARPGDDSAVQLVGCGRSIDGQEIIVAEPDGGPELPEGRVGEVLVRGPSIAREYWNRPGSTTQVFAAPVPGRTEQFLRTGDLGFFWRGELFISGRIKDILIIRGRNHAASDLETSVEAELGARHRLRPGRIVAFSVPRPEHEPDSEPDTEFDSEVAVIVAELRVGERADDARLIATDMARVIAEHHQLSVHTVVLLPRAGLPLTSSGKVRRRTTRDMFLAGELTQTGQVTARVTLGRDPDRALPDPGPEECALYDSLAFVRDKLDARKTDYRFDLERDVPWHRQDEPGLHAPPALLETFGIDAEALCRDREVFTTFQWALAMSICKSFELLEWGIMQFIHSQRDQLGSTRSIDDLYSEEEKHIQLFRRIASHLGRQRPQLVEPFEDAFRETYTFLRGLFTGCTGADLHYRILLATLFFEPATLHLAEALADSEESIQPLWLHAHELHAREERQHVATVAAYAEALCLDRDHRRRIAAAFTAEMERGYSFIYGLAAPLRLVQTLWPELPSLHRADGRLPAGLASEILSGRSFRALRSALPDVAELLPGAGPQTRELPAPEVVFVLSSERSGSTLLRVMLSGHPDVFAPPELNLLGYETLSQRSNQLPEVQRDGLDLAVAGLLGTQPAEQEVARWHAADLSTADVYRRLLAELTGRVLVDKSPGYSRDLASLRRAESLFGRRARYIHLVRHPYAVIDSYVRIGLERLVTEQLAGAGDHGKDAYELGEMGWTLSNRTIETFREDIEPARWATVYFEDLVCDPMVEASRLCTFIDVPFSRRVVEPYRYGQMTERMSFACAVGDPNFHGHTGIDANLADSWRSVRLPRPLGPAARARAAAYGYSLPADEDAASAPQNQVPPPGASSTPTGGPGTALTDAALKNAVIETIATATGQLPATLHEQTTFASLGLDSLRLIRLTNDLEKRLANTLPAMTLYDHPTVGELVAYLARERGALDIPDALERPSTPAMAERVDLDAEVYLSDDIAAARAGARASTDREVLLTGATGFLGAHLLGELMRSTSAHVHCLVRADDAASGLARVRRNLQRYGIRDAEFIGRISAVPGDLAVANLGLSDRVFAEMAERVDSIIHNGALLRFNASYRQLAPANVEGTREVLRLATQTRLKTVHYVSSMSVFDRDADERGDQAVDETCSAPNWRALRLGYSQTKWVSERLLELAGERGVPVNIFRCAGIGGHGQTGAWNTDDIVCRTIKGCVDMGLAPELSFDLDIAPVDYVSQALVWLAHNRPAGAVYHLNNPEPLTWIRLMRWMQFQGFDLSLTAHERWIENLAQEARSMEHPLSLLVPYFCTRWMPHRRTLLQTRENRPQVRCSQTQAALSGSGLRCPPMDQALLATWFNYFAKQGFLSP